MTDSQTFPTLIEFLNVIDPQNTLDYESIGKEIAFLAMINAAQDMRSYVPSETQDLLNKILSNNGENIISELLQYFDSVDKKDTYMKKVADLTNYWTVDFMISMYKGLSEELRKNIDTAWPGFTKVMP